MVNGVVQEDTVLTMTFEGEPNMKELMGLSRLNVNFQSPSISWNRVINTKIVLYNIVDNDVELNLVVFNAMFSDTQCTESALILAGLIYEKVEEARMNKQKYADLSELLTYSFEEDKRFYTPQDIEKTLAKYCLITRSTEDADKYKIA